ISQSEDDHLTIPLLLGICYSASIGGMGTPIGTPPNAAFVSIYQEYFDKDTSFMDWMKMAIPLVLILLPITGFWLTRNVGDTAEVKLPHSGKWRQEESRTLIVFLFIAAAWVLRKEPFGGWQNWLGLPKASDADVALLGVVLLFLIPNGEKPGDKLLDWETAVKIPWGILLLFSGGLVIASGFKEVGLSTAIGSQMAHFIEFHPFFVILCTCLMVTFLTEVTSNTASTLLLLPIIAEMVQASDIIENPAMLMIPATISASCAFMLPVATAPNAIIFGSRKVSINRMAKEGFVLNIVAALAISTYFYFYFC
ncbi:MAG: anion permease, partial [Lentisphaerales bacterium]|nr:anion permease [Lentisphaerales bacterium]